MLRWSLPRLREKNTVAIRSHVSLGDLSYTKRYAPAFRQRLAKRFDVVTEENRYDGLRLLLEKLSAHVGRRQYAMAADLGERYLARFKGLGLDWFDLKALGPEQLYPLLRYEVKMPASDRAVLQTALHVRTCGVITEGTRQTSRKVCMREGLEEHGWRCGHAGHTSGVYFEAKGPRGPHTMGQLSAARLLASTVDPATGAVLPAEDGVTLRAERVDLTTSEDGGIRTHVRPELDFSVEGRLDHAPHPRVWASPTDPVFDVLSVGFDFDVHWDDPRAGPQIADAAGEWQMHAEVVRTVLWEMLEANAFERGLQPLDLRPGDVPVPDGAQSVHDAQQCFTATDPDTGVLIEHRMEVRPSAAAPASTVPWFRPAPPRAFVDGVPPHLPFAPTVAVQARYHLPEGAAPGSEEALRAPLVEVSLLSHPEACFYWADQEAADRALAQVLDYAKRIPYAVPFTLYYRIDPAAFLQRDPVAAGQRESRLKDKAHFFDVASYVATAGGRREAVSVEGEAEDVTHAAMAEDQRRAEEQEADRMQRTQRRPNDGPFPAADDWE